MDFLHRLIVNEDKRRSFTGVGNDSRYALSNFLRRQISKFSREEFLSEFLDKFYPICPIFPSTQLKDLLTDVFRIGVPNPAILAFCYAVLALGAKVLDSKESVRLYNVSGSILEREESLDPLYAFMTYLLLVLPHEPVYTPN